MPHGDSLEHFSVRPFSKKGYLRSFAMMLSAAIPRSAFAAPRFFVRMSTAPRKLHAARCIDKPDSLELRKANRSVRSASPP